VVLKKGGGRVFLGEKLELQYDGIKGKEKGLVQLGNRSIGKADQLQYYLQSVCAKDTL